jgi:bacillithiol biosynthesis deacetylase BshB1
MSSDRIAMVVAPHPDDAELAMGGTISKLLQCGWDLVVVDLTDGEPTPCGTRERRAAETREASRLLGISKRICLGMPNRHLEATIENRRKLAGTIRIHRPAVLFGPLGPDYHPDHTAAARLLEESRFEARLCKTDLPGEPHWVPRLYSYYSTYKPRGGWPSLVVDVTDVWDRKMAAIRAYESQAASRPAGGCATLAESVDVMGRSFGLAVGCRYGEPFLSREPVAIRDPDVFLGLD